MQPGDCFVGAFVSNQLVGKRFKQWPLHVTIVSWARSEQDSGELTQALSENLKNIQPFEAVVGREERLVNGTVLVNLIEQPIMFDKLFTIVKNTEDKLGFQFVSNAHPSYKPHVTVQPTERLQEGDKFLVRKLIIIEQKGDYKEVVGEVSLNG
jgi:hypothetical protein